jgi:hypothetical protein
MLLNLDGSRFVKDRVENSDLTVPMTSTKHGTTFFVPQTDDDFSSLDDDSPSTDATHRINLKRKHTESDVDSIVLPPPLAEVLPSSSLSVAIKATTTTTRSESASEPVPSTTVISQGVITLLRHYAHVCAVNVNETLLENAELCGSNLAVKLMQMGADSILEEIQQNVVVIPTP